MAGAARRPVERVHEEDPALLLYCCNPAGRVKGQSKKGRSGLQQLRGQMPRPIYETAISYTAHEPVDITREALAMSVATFDDSRFPVCQEQDGVLCLARQDAQADRLWDCRGTH